MVDDPKSTPQARARRLKRLRNLANLTRVELCDIGNLNVNTLKGWEVARFGGISKVGARKVIACLKKRGVYASIDWLLYEVGAEPKVTVFSSETSQTLEYGGADDTIHRASMIDELLLFRQHYKNSLDLEITDDSFEPIYSKGDIVAGKIAAHLKKTYGKACLVRKNDGSIILRLVNKSMKKNLVNLSSINPNTTVIDPVTYEVQTSAIAPVIWHRKPIIK